MASKFMVSDRDVVIVASCRTPIGKFRGVLASVRADDLLALVFSEVTKRVGLDVSHIDEAFAGCANQAGEDNRNVARMAVLLAKLPQKISAVTVNRLCASGLEAVVQGTRSIQCGDAEVILVGGVENMSRAPWVMAKPESAFPSGAPTIFDTSLGWRFPNKAMAAMFPLEQMGETAENVAEKYHITREEQDAFAFRSHQRACVAQAKALFQEEIIPVEIMQKKGPPLIVRSDEQPRQDTTLDALAALKPAFRAQGTVTAGNASTLNDGAAALILTSRAYAKAHGLPIQGVIRGAASAGVDPRLMGIGPVESTKKLFSRYNISARDLSCVELNEAFAAQVLAVIRELNLNEANTNVCGGAIALGHPLGCSGARIATTLLHTMKREQHELGLASLCVGVGQGLSVLFSRE